MPGLPLGPSRLFEARRDFTRFGEDADADPGNPWLAWGLYLAWQRGESRGWRRGLRFAVRRALIIVLSRHQPGDTVPYSEAIPLQQALGLRAGRTTEVLQEIGVLADDRRPSFESWLKRSLDGLAPGIRADAESWLRTLRDGGPRSRPRNLASAWNHMVCLRSVLLDWSGRYGHLREVTRDDVLAVLGGFTGPAAPTSWWRCGRCSRSARSRGRSSAARSRASGSASGPPASSSR